MTDPVRSLSVLCAAAIVLAGCTTTRTTSPEPPLDGGRELREGHEFTPDAMLRVADNLRASGDHMSAMRLYQQVRERDPKNTAALLGQAESLLALGAAGEAERRYRAAKALGAEDSRVEAGLARALVRQNRAEEALPHFAAALRQGAGNARLYNHYGVALDLLGRHEEAQVQYGTGLDLAPRDPGLLNNIGLSFALGGDHETAVRILSELVTATPEAGTARRNLALAYGLSGDFEAAEQLSKLDRTSEELAREMAYIRQVAGLPSDLRPRAIILGLDAVAGLAVTPAAPLDQVGPEREPALAPQAPSQPAPESRLPESLPPGTAPSATFGVQLGAYPNETVAAAFWPKIQAAAPDLLRERAPVYRHAGEIVRLILPSESWSAATGLCAALKEAGVDCLPRRLRETP